MKQLLTIAALAAAALTGTASAQDRHGDRDGRDGRMEQRHEDRGDRGDHNDRGDRSDRRGDSQERYADGRRNDRYDYSGYDRGDRDRGAGPRHDMRRGARLPSEYRNRQYVVDDWRGHRLSAPPRGYHWVQTGDDYVLAAVATGVIASIILGH